jgi:hypothetical protein
MAYIGLKHPVFAPIATEPANSLPTYGTGLVVGMAIAADVSIELSDAKLAADDTIAEIENGFVSGTISMGVDDVSDAVLKAWLGVQDASLGGEATLREAATYDSPEGGFGYYRVRKKAGVRSYRAFWYHKTKWGMPGENAATKPDGSIEWQTPTIEGEIMTALDLASSWRDQATFTSEADAIAWLDGLAGVPTSESTGLSGLEMAGAGGTLSPAFAAGVRYYTFDGVTATGVTVKATAADHSLKLYVDGVFSQNLTSGQASDTIAMAEVGSKKLTVIAQELGKTSQVTEIVVVKTT